MIDPHGVLALETANLLLERVARELGPEYQFTLQRIQTIQEDEVRLRALLKWCNEIISISEEIKKRLN